MAIKKGNKYLCSYCRKDYINPAQADVCRESHDLVYVPMSRSDLNRMIQFIHLKNDELLTDSLVNTLRRYLGRI